MRTCALIHPLHLELETAEAYQFHESREPYGFLRVASSRNRTASLTEEGGGPVCRLIHVRKRQFAGAPRLSISCNLFKAAAAFREL